MLRRTHLMIAAAAALAATLPHPAHAQVPGQTRDVYWIDESTTLPEPEKTPESAMDAKVNTEPVMDLDTVPTEDTTLPAEPKPTPSEILLGKKTAPKATDAAKKSAEPPADAKKPKVEVADAEPSDKVSYEGTVKSITTLNDNTLEIQLEQENGEIAVGYVAPGKGLRVPGQGSLIRMTGKLISDRGTMDAVEVDRVDRLGGGAQRSQQRTTTRQTQPRPAPRYVPQRYSYPPGPRLWP